MQKEMPVEQEKMKYQIKRGIQNGVEQLALEFSERQAKACEEAYQSADFAKIYDEMTGTFEKEEVEVSNSFKDLEKRLSKLQNNLKKKLSGVEKEKKSAIKKKRS